LDDIQESQILRCAFLLCLIEFGTTRRNSLYARRRRRAFHLAGCFHSSRVQFAPQLVE
jgi:hypothetical protein